MNCTAKAMTLQDYQTEIKRFQNNKSTLATIALGVAGEAGEVADLVKKIVDHGITEYKGKDALEALADELGDVLWYVARLTNYLELNLGTLARNNITKLDQRYPSGFVEGGGIR